MTELNEKQQRFCEEYMLDLNGTQAAIRAGYSAHSAARQASRLLGIAPVRAELSRLKAAQSKRIEISADKLLHMMAQIAFGDIRGIFDVDGHLKPPHEWDEDTAATVAGLDIVTSAAGKGAVKHVAKIRRSDRLRAMELLARHLSLFNEKANGAATEDLAARMRRAKERKKERKK
ncbi:MAG: terminase small subunit [Cohaesibacter sp.]|nr:terminase small subunit [Cohaesibacter sp.]